MPRVTVLARDGTHQRDPGRDQGSDGSRIVDPGAAAASDTHATVAIAANVGDSIVLPPSRSTGDVQ